MMKRQQGLGCMWARRVWTMGCMWAWMDEWERNQGWMATPPLSHYAHISQTLLLAPVRVPCYCSKKADNDTAHHTDWRVTKFTVQQQCNAVARFILWVIRTCGFVCGGNQWIAEGRTTLLPFPSGPD